MIRLCAKSREGLETTVEFLTLHAQLRTLTIAGEFQKLLQLKEEIGELSTADHERYLKLKKVGTWIFELEKNEISDQRASTLGCCRCDLLHLFDCGRQANQEHPHQMRPH